MSSLAGKLTRVLAPAAMSTACRFCQPGKLAAKAYRQDAVMTSMTPGHFHSIFTSKVSPSRCKRTCGQACAIWHAGRQNHNWQNQMLKPRKAVMSGCNDDVSATAHQSINIQQHQARISAGCWWLLNDWWWPLLLRIHLNVAKSAAKKFVPSPSLPLTHEV